MEHHLAWRLSSARADADGYRSRYPEVHGGGDTCTRRRPVWFVHGHAAGSRWSSGGGPGAAPRRPPPERARAGEAWERRGFNQFRLPHVMLPPWRARMERELPEVLDEVLAAGGLRLHTLALLPGPRRGPPRRGG